VTLAFKRDVAAATRGLPNVHVHDLQAEATITHDLDRYTDIYHFDAAVNDWMVRTICGSNGATPADLAARQVIVVSPVIATANTAVAAIDRLKERGATDIRTCCLIAAPEGVERLRGIHPDVKLWTAALDDHLDKDAFIIPGLGDAGDRAYGTK